MLLVNTKLTYQVTTQHPSTFSNNFTSIWNIRE